MMVVLTVLCGFIYPLALTGLAEVLFPKQAAGSLLVRDGRVIGSELIGRQFDDPRYFWGRPSATERFPYNAAASGGSNLGPNHPERRRAVEARSARLRAADPLNTRAVPLDLLTASGSGLDPDISPEAAEYQTGRVARLRGVERVKVEESVRRHTRGRVFGVWGEPRVNVVLLNEELDRL